ncbi:MAG: PDZ domain-containing protein [Verrucomicrobiota bacterium]|nr:PDZ domain-containing protein [Verrucomicrobiota bacterium]
MRFVLFFLIFLLAVEGIPPVLTPVSAKKKLEDVLKNHALYKELSPQLMERILNSFLEELDPMKVYLIENEIDAWINPSEELLKRALVQWKNSDYSLFTEIHALFLQAIERRHQIEKNLKEGEIPAPEHQIEEYDRKKTPWAKDQKELEERIAQVTALQLHAFRKLEEKERDRCIQLVGKRRLHREAELRGEKENSESTVLTLFLKAALSSLDTHTNYFTPTEANQFMIQVQQRLFGIGAQLNDDLDGLRVLRILENSPASLSGELKINDKIIAVNGEPIVGLDITEAVEQIRGPRGTEVKLTVLRNNEEEAERLEIVLVRDEIRLEETRVKTSVEPYGDGIIAALRLFSFYQDEQFSSASDLRDALTEMQKEKKLKGLILDLRGNAGGLLNQAVAVSGLFMTSGVVVSVKDETGKIQHLRTMGTQPAWDGPLLILVDKASASAAEIVAQALQDYGRALVVGDVHTFGKGSFQICTLDAITQSVVRPDGEYKVTRGIYYTVSGKSPQLRGVKADVVVPGPFATAEIGEEFTSFPLPNDRISAHFEDDLSDLPPFQRLQIGPSYLNHLQLPIASYQLLLPTLQSNAQERIAKNLLYQNGLEEMERKHFDSLPVDLFHQSDLQLMEAKNILKDLIYLRAVS